MSFDLNQTTLSPVNQCIHQLFEQQVEKTPNAVAVSFEEQFLTYRELNARANQLAHYLGKLGVNPEQLVGICIERSLEMIIGLLGILKAGGAYLPLDPTYPQERLEFMVEDAQISVLVTQEKLKAHLPLSNINAICLDKDGQILSQQSQQNPKPAVSVENLAYILYTSGSTGLPKGVLITHKGLTNLATVEIELFNVQPSSRVVQFASLNFDVSVSEIFTTLCSGARLCLGSPNSLLPGEILRQFLEKQAITHAALPPSILAVLPQAPLNDLQVLIVGGEACPPKLMAQWAVGRRFFNAYGPTEATVDATIAECSPERPLTIGRPLPNVQAYILDESLKQLPVGVTGELHIGGVGLARGYLNRPELTQTKFIPHPFSDNPSSKLYKTGDLARYLPDGNIEWLGRIDYQVKIRGLRIELGEIERVLAQYSAIKSAVVIPTEDRVGDKRLMAYVVPHLVSSDAAEQEKAQQEYLSLWKTVYQQTDSETPIQNDITFDIFGWDSSYNGQPIPEVEMREWVEQTVERIKDLYPKKVLEIGCGTGLLLARIAPNCTEYVGIDFSRPALDHIRKIQQEMGGLDHVTLLERTADDLEGFQLESFDTVIINSVLQHFPSAAYLLRVLEGVIKLVKKGGHIFLGDIRNLALLETYCASVEAYRANDNLLASQLQEKITRKQKNEEELLLDPFFFLALQQKFPEISHIQIKPKKGVYHNELTRFRYEAILSINNSLEVLREVQWLDWQQEKLTLAEIQRILTEDKPASLGIRFIPNARLNQEVYVQKWLEKASKQSTIKHLNQWLSQQPENGVEIDTIFEMAKDLPYHVEISWINTEATGSYDVVFSQKASPFQPAIFSVNSQIKDMFTYANNPLRTKFNQQLASQLRKFLKSKLPEYMIPTGISILEKLPLTPNDKIDRQALANLSPDNYLLPENKANFVAPRTTEEEVLANLWAEVLQLDQIGIHDNFFELGGNSLKVIVLLNRIQETFSKNLQMVDLFKSPTIAELVTCLQEKFSLFDTIERITANSPDEICYFPPTLFQERVWSQYQLNPIDNFENPPNNFHLIGHLDKDILARSFNEIIRRHEILRTTLQEINGSLMQVVVPTATINLPVIDLQNLSETEQNQEIERLSKQEIQIPLLIDKEPWWRVTLVQLAEKSYLLVIYLHRLLSDDKSIDILLQELSVLYEAFLSSKPSPLPGLAIQYGDYARNQRQSLTPEVLQTKREYWQQWLNGEPPRLVFPTTKSLPEVPTFRADIFEQKLSCELTQQLNTFSQLRRVTLFTTIMTAFASLIAQESGCEEMVIGIPATNRNHWQLESLIGEFGKMLLLKLDLSGNPSFSLLLNRARQEMLSVITNQDLPWGQLAKILKLERKRHHPPFGVIVDFLLDSPTRQWQLPDLTITLLPPLQESLTRVDLMLLVWEQKTDLGTSLQVWWRYATDVFEVNTISRMAESFQSILETIINEK